MSADHEDETPVDIPYLAQELHLWRVKRVVLWEFQLCWEDAAFKWCSFGPLDQSLPDEEILFVNWACGDSIWWGSEERLVLLEEAFRGDGGVCHGLRC